MEQPGGTGPDGPVRTLDRPSAAPTDVRPSPPPGPPPPAPAAEGTPTAYPEKWGIALAVISVGAFMSVLDISIVNVAIPTMANQFGVDAREIEWVTTAYSLSLGVIVPVSGWLGERFGLSKVYAWAVLGFAGASALCGFAWNLESEVAFRILQAIPGGILPVITLTMLYKIVPPNKLGIGMAVYGVSMVFAPATGPTLGGYLVEYHSWRWIFFINIPIGLIGAALAFWVLPKFDRKPDLGRFDWWGFITVAGGLFALLLALSKGIDWGWGGYRILGLFTASALLLALFVIVELEVERPLLNVRLFLIWSFSNSLILIGILSSAFFTIIFYLPLFMQEGQGVTPVNTGLAMLPEAICMAFSLPAAGLLYDKMGPRWPIVIGMLFTAYGTWLLTDITSDMTTTDVMLWTSLRGCGQAFCMVPLMTAGLAKVPPGEMDGASAINNVMQRVAGALGLAVLSTMVTRLSVQNHADRSALITEAGMRGDPTLGGMVDPAAMAAGQADPGLMLAYLKLWELKIQAQAYSNLYLFLTVATLFGAVLALTFPSEKPEGTDGHRPMALEM
jgi:EmrB/QacA subfamily drug resistance transporter